jgi:aryl-alcohol dehydrogenase-like predicted oxidoreductase
MQMRVFPRNGWQISEIGYGMWGMGDWSGSDDEESLKSLDYAVSLGCNFFDTAFVYGKGHSEKLLGQVLRNHPGKRLYSATKIPPKNAIWPSRSEVTLDEAYPPEHIREYAEKSLANLGVDTVDLLYFHTWNDRWAPDERWKRALDDLKREKLASAVGISINRWEPANVIETLKTGLIDAVQVVYNIFDQAPEDELYPVCEQQKVAVVARVPLDEGSLTGTLTTQSTWPEGDFRQSYFQGGNLVACVARANALKSLVPEGMSLSEMALRFILSHPAVTAVIPGMRKTRHVEENIKAGDGEGLPPELVEKLRKHRWDRDPVTWRKK